MIRSMTGFGRGTTKNDKTDLSVDIKTLNHRYLDMYIRLPRQYAFLEEKIRNKLSKILLRGKVEVYVNIDEFNEEIYDIQIDQNLAQLYYNSLIKLKEQFRLRDDINVSLISRFPEVLKPKKSDDLEDKLWGYLEEALDMASISLVSMREKEGETLQDNFIEKLSILNHLAQQISAYADNVTKDYREKLMNKLEDLIKLDHIDENRIANEVAIFAERSCIDEELVRFQSHTNQFKDILKDNVKDSVGKKLDFLIQEMIREVNTIGSKATNVNITKYVVEMKSEIEKLREQVQNIE